jgi:hypothetical protein
MHPTAMGENSVLHRGAKFQIELRINNPNLVKMGVVS